jgi:hypothetical protein
MCVLAPCMREALGSIHRHTKEKYTPTLIINIDEKNPLNN